MDRNRLKDVHQTDLTEGRLNQDLVDWLKTKGPTWLLFVLVAVVAYLAVVRYRQHLANYRNEAWQKLIDIQATSNPEGFEEIAIAYGSVDGIGMVARLEGAERLLRSIQTRTPINPDGSTSLPGTMTAEQRSAAIARAERFYDEMIAQDNQSIGHTMFAVAAFNGRAALAEAKGDAAEARQWYERAISRAGDVYPQLAEQARSRIATLDEVTRDVMLPTSTVQESFPPLTPSGASPALLEIINRPSGTDSTAG